MARFAILGGLLVLALFAAPAPEAGAFGHGCRACGQRAGIFARWREARAARYGCSGAAAACSGAASCSGSAASCSGSTGCSGSAGCSGTTTVEVIEEVVVPTTPPPAPTATPTAVRSTSLAR